jgi:transcriptional regulator with XRE-family HTH domain
MFLASNLKILRKTKGLSQEEVSKTLGLTRSTYSGYENGIAEPGIQNMLMMSDFYKVSLDELIKRDLSKLSPAELATLSTGLNADIKGGKLRVLTTVVNQENEEIIEMIPEKARAGYTMGYSDPDYIKVLPTFQLPFLKKDRKYRSFPIHGDSMPPVSHGSHVVAEFVQNWETVKDGKPYIVVTKDDGIVFKLVYNHLAKSNSFQLCSTNPLYDPYHVHVNDVIEIWKFVNYISPELPDVEIPQNDMVKSLKSLQKDVHELKHLWKDA